MSILTTAPRGTKDILPRDSAKWQYVEKTLLETAALFGFQEIRVPTFEHTELFSRSVGETTDVVNKEMYTFTDKGGRSLTLRPEGTAGVARAVIENGLLGEALPPTPSSSPWSMRRSRCWGSRRSMWSSTPSAAGAAGRSTTGR